MFSPTSIANFIACPHLTSLDRAAAAGEIKRLFFADPLLDFLIRLGEAHEQAYLTQLTDQGLSIVQIPTDDSRRDAAARAEAAARTVDAIRSGADVIYQASFLADADSVAAGPGTHGRDARATTRATVWYGRADFLIRVDKPSELGAFSYEVVETKARALDQGTGHHPALLLF